MDEQDSKDDFIAERTEDDDLDSTNLTEPAAIETDRRRDDEEIAEEITADDYDGPLSMEDDDATEVNSVYGWIGIALSVVSFFIMPIILGAAGIILGFISRSRGADALGNTAIAAGAISILITLFVIPFVYRNRPNFVLSLICYDDIGGNNKND